MSEQPVVKRGRGRPKKLVVPVEVKPLSEEDLSALCEKVKMVKVEINKVKAEIKELIPDELSDSLKALKTTLKALENQLFT